MWDIFGGITYVSVLVNPGSAGETEKASTETVIENQVTASLTQQSLINSRFMSQARNRFAADVNGKSLSGLNHVGPLAYQGSIGSSPSAMAAHAMAIYEDEDSETHARFVVSGGLTFSFDDDGSKSLMGSGRLAREHRIDEDMLFGYFLGVDLGKADVDGTYSGDQTSIGGNIGAYAVKRIHQAFFADMFVQVGRQHNDLALSNGTTDVDGTYWATTALIGSSLSGVISYDDFNLIPEVSASLSHVWLSGDKFDATASGSTTDLDLNTENLTIARLQFTPQIQTPFNALSSDSRTATLSFGPSVLCQHKWAREDTSECGGGGSLSLDTVSLTDGSSIRANLDVERLGDTTTLYSYLRYNRSF
ncbi:autotransporter outer membrane beta-barrel domain-containing protein [Cohaesibacter sp. CAU 1516]|uniref:autotransporter domain-containing protein n=1 Tax=Cohaesibacter sp. CAU 1516 TaxID=2576038 RepID=UPI0010FF3B22|nr:autotransporter domain-containing protein [Cohaesibacter sp. CAU 1516]TLP43854.1 autotransporter outer membrane beta-barrel domain-containing protein [Cohaesibacter sp. CAU 1516]